MIHGGKITDPSQEIFVSRMILPEKIMNHESVKSLLVQMIVYDDKPVGL